MKALKLINKIRDSEVEYGKYGLIAQKEDLIASAISSYFLFLSDEFSKALN